MIPSVWLYLIALPSKGSRGTFWIMLGVSEVRVAGKLPVLFLCWCSAVNSMVARWDTCVLHFFFTAPWYDGSRSVYSIEPTGFGTYIFLIPIAESTSCFFFKKNSLGSVNCTFM